MQQQKLGSRVDVVELKGMIVNRLGVERSKRYFYYLNRLLNQTLSKSEFDKLCQRVLGRENLPLHNQLIQAVLKNVCTAKIRPVSEECPEKTATEDGQGQVLLQFGVSGTSAVTWANGVASPRKVRVDSREWKFRNQHGLAENDKDKTRPEPLGRHCRSSAAADGMVSLDRKDKGVEQYGRLSYSSSPLLAPLGIPFCSASISSSHCKAFSVTTTDTHLRCCSSGELSETETLRARMEKIAALRNLGGVSLECANLLNTMLDVYLKRLIMSCINSVETKSDDGSKGHSVHQKQLVEGKYLNGIFPNNQHYMATSSGMGTLYNDRPNPVISLLDFKVAMELNPQQLGEDWPSIFEKICLYSFKY